MRVYPPHHVDFHLEVLEKNIIAPCDAAAHTALSSSCFVETCNISRAVGSSSLLVVEKTSERHPSMI